MLFSKYCEQIKIEKAKEMLMDPSVRISDIACTLGYNNVSHFNFMYKKT